MRLENRVTVITAAGSGMGRAEALRFAAEGSIVYATDIDGAAVEAVAAEAADAGSAGSVVPRPLDVADRAAVGQIFAEVERDHGHLHVLLNNAGIPGPAGVALENEEWTRCVDVNLRSVFYTTEFALPLLRTTVPQASIICTASVAGIVGSPVGILYSATKGAVIMFVKSLALSLGPEGIRVNALCPGSTSTPMLKQFFERGGLEAPPPDVVDKFIADTVPLGRTAKPEEIAGAALFLACDDSAFVHGTTLEVDGGYIAR
jgi:NAD(P)-dependent dehydrogenase (short-subunit alcohol dehydrogenase family)